MQDTSAHAREQYLVLPKPSSAQAPHCKRPRASKRALIPKTTPHLHSAYWRINLAYRVRQPIDFRRVELLNTSADDVEVRERIGCVSISFRIVSCDPFADSL